MKKTHRLQAMLVDEHIMIFLMFISSWINFWLNQQTSSVPVCVWWHTREWHTKQTSSVPVCVWRHTREWHTKQTPSVPVCVWWHTREWHTKQTPSVPVCVWWQPREWHTKQTSWVTVRVWWQSREWHTKQTSSVPVSEGRAAQRMAHHTELFSTCMCLMAHQRMTHQTDLFNTLSEGRTAQRMTHQTDPFSIPCLRAGQPREWHTKQTPSVYPVWGQGSPENDIPNRPLQYTLSEGRAAQRMTHQTDPFSIYPVWGRRTGTVQQRRYKQMSR